MSEHTLVEELEAKLKQARIKLCEAKPSEREDCEREVTESENQLREAYLGFRMEPAKTI